MSGGFDSKKVMPIRKHPADFDLLPTPPFRQGTVLGIVPKEPGSSKVPHPASSPAPQPSMSTVPPTRTLCTQGEPMKKKRGIRLRFCAL